MQKLSVKQVKIKDIEKHIEEENFTRDEKIEGIVKDFGFKNSIVIRDEDIVVSLKLLEAAKILKLEDMPAMIIDERMKMIIEEQ